MAEVGKSFIYISWLILWCITLWFICSSRLCFYAFSIVYPSHLLVLLCMYECIWVFLPEINCTYFYLHIATYTTTINEIQKFSTMINYWVNTTKIFAKHGQSWTIILVVYTWQNMHLWYICCQWWADIWQKSDCKPFLFVLYEHRQDICKLYTKIRYII